MTKRRAAWAGVAVVGAVACLVAPGFLRPQPRINFDSFRQIEVGMMQAEVERVIGAPPGGTCLPSP
jgi:hypothetical protein